MKKQCVIITAYKEPGTLRSLLDVLHSKFVCFVHIDKKAKQLFSGIEIEFPDVRFFFKYSVNWGGVEHLRAIVDLLALTLSIEYSYAHIISGEDFPVKPVDEIQAYFNGSDRIWCECKSTERGKSRRHRWFNYYWPYVRFKLSYKNRWVRIGSIAFIAIQSMFPFIKRKSLGEFREVYGGLIWASYPKEAVDYLVSYFESHSDFWNTLEWCKIPEELAFQTILKNSYLAGRIANDNKRYGDMKRGDGWGPVYLEDDDLKIIDESDAFFARKIRHGSKLESVLQERQDVQSLQGGIMHNPKNI